MWKPVSGIQVQARNCTKESKRDHLQGYIEKLEINCVHISQLPFQEREFSVLEYSLSLYSDRHIQLDGF